MSRLLGYIPNIYNTPSQLVRVEISSTASAMPLARAHKVERAKQAKKKTLQFARFFLCQL